MAVVPVFLVVVAVVVVVVVVAVDDGLHASENGRRSSISRMLVTAPVPDMFQLFHCLKVMVKVSERQ